MSIVIAYRTCISWDNDTWTGPTTIFPVAFERWTHAHAQNHLPIKRNQSHITVVSNCFVVVVVVINRDSEMQVNSNYSIQLLCVWHALFTNLCVSFYLLCRAWRLPCFYHFQQRKTYYKWKIARSLYLHLFCVNSHRLVINGALFFIFICINIPYLFFSVVCKFFSLFFHLNRVACCGLSCYVCLSVWFSVQKIL